MKFSLFIVTVAGLIAPVIMTRAEGLHPAPQVGDTYEITLSKESAHQDANGSSGSSHDRDTIIERVVGLRADGMELQYDLPTTESADDKTRNWQFPARTYMPYGGPPKLINSAELEARVDRWLKASGQARSACGHWIFTWNAFRIECDPQSVIKTIQSFDLRIVDLREGSTYQEPDSRGYGKLAR